MSIGALALFQRSLGLFDIQAAARVELLGQDAEPLPDHDLAAESTSGQFAPDRWNAALGG
jgi:hypothetical protein